MYFRPFFTLILCTDSQMRGGKRVLERPGIQMASVFWAAISSPNSRVFIVIAAIAASMSFRLLVRFFRPLLIVNYPFIIIIVYYRFIIIYRRQITCTQTVLHGIGASSTTFIRSSKGFVPGQILVGLLA